MAYTKPRTNVLRTRGPRPGYAAMGDVCAPGQLYNPDFSPCTPPGQAPIAPTWQAPQVSVTPTGTPSTTTSSGGSALDAFFRALTPTPPMMMPGMVPGMMPQAGLSTGTALALAGGAVLLAVLLSR